ncbi:MAG: guanylate kinase, partial [Rhodospirillales bacterium]|nr:guanylate kinase [Rhodospirillales bacterium]
MNAPETNATRQPNARLDATRDGLVLVLSAASGSGKTTVLRRLLETEPRLAMSVSVTTRKPRAAERRGDHYRFVGEADFARLHESVE